MWVGHTGLVLALDSLPTGCRELGCLRELLSSFSGVKVGLPLLLSEGPEFLRDIAGIAGELGILRIADFKLADIGDVMGSSLELIKKLGYEVAIAHSFIGVRGGLDVLVGRARELGVSVALVVSMSHEGSREFYDSYFSKFLEVAGELRVWGVVAPATRLNLVRKARDTLGSSVKILAPGVGVQGAEYGAALCSGANYEIVGRSVVRSPNPIRAARAIAEEFEKKVRECLTNYV
ncbi:MAG: orotidine-5'-phosphate decarboxylase [Sulfolobales archaeon]|nr:orotidine-5'-phosphate decarboxylase [Sulfolobales archaeon]